MGAMASQITGVSAVCPTVCSNADQRKHQNSASLAFVRVIYLSPVNSPHKGQVTRKISPFVDLIMPWQFNQSFLISCQTYPDYFLILHWGVLCVSNYEQKNRRTSRYRRRDRRTERRAVGRWWKHSLFWWRQWFLANQKSKPIYVMNYRFFSLKHRGRVTHICVNKLSNPCFR